MKTAANPYPSLMPARFNFTQAIEGGAWLEWRALSSAGMREDKEWVPFAAIIAWFGRDWLDRQIKRQGWMTGCWIDCV